MVVVVSLVFWAKKTVCGTAKNPIIHDYDGPNARVAHYHPAGDWEAALYSSHDTL